ncbi:MAG: hypothetical protein D4R82_06150 [Dehalococcoidia bacterium]|nr:MAG: hypothetical protein D4R82_06150 [Dehalococcoidia bacterium]
MKGKATWVWVGVAALVIVSSLALSCAPKKVAPTEFTEYVIPTCEDWSGPFAGQMEAYSWGRNAVFDWWNDTVGRESGIKLTPKGFDSRFDTSVIASVWPGLKDETNAIAYLGMGGADVAALRERLPDDKVPGIVTTATYSFEWAEEMNWMIRYRPTYMHELFALFDLLLKEWPEGDLPIRIGHVSFDKTPVGPDCDKGLAALTKLDKYRGKLEYVGTVWTEWIPVDITEAMRPLIAEDVDFVFCSINAAHVVATYKACEALGKHIPIIVSSHIGLIRVAEVLGGWEKMEGYYEVAGLSGPLNHDSRAFKEIWMKYHPAEVTDAAAQWGYDHIQIGAQVMLLGRAVEEAAAAVGANNLTGQAIYDAFLSMDLTEKECMGYLRGAKWTMESPCPVVNRIGVQIGTVKDGKYTMATSGWVPCPEIPMW